MRLLTVNDRTYELALEVDLDALHALIAENVRLGGGFVEFTTVGGATMSVLFSPASRVEFSKVSYVVAESTESLTEAPRPRLSDELLTDF